MAFENRQVSFSYTAGENHDNLTAGSGALYKAIAINDQKFANNGLEASGILIYGAKSGEYATAVISGISKFTAGAAITAGQQLTVSTSGYITAAASGDAVVGMNWESSVASGAIGTGVFQFGTNPAFDVASGTRAGQVSFTSQADLTVALAQYKAITVSSGDFASAPTAGAILYTGTASGSTSFGRSVGQVTARAGGVILNGQSLTAAASGWVVAANSGQVIIGRALSASAAANSGSTFTAMVNFATPHFATNCFDVMYS